MPMDSGNMSPAMESPAPSAKEAEVSATMAERSRLVNDEIERVLAGLEPANFARGMREYLRYSKNRIRPSFAVYAPIRHVLEAGGKRVRPLLCLLACETVGGDLKKALPTAAGIEFLHTFTLVHDDVCDRSLTRRARPTVGAIWGDPVAITVGDGLFALAMRLMSRDSVEAGVSADVAARILAMGADTSLMLAQGQTMDLMFTSRDDVTVDEYMEMIRLKTGVLLEFSLKAGAVIGGGSREQVDAIAEFGAPLGMAFQIRDDVLDLTADPKTLGKPLGGDIRTGKRTLIVAHGVENSPKRDVLIEILNKPEDETTMADVATASEILQDAGSIEYAQQRARSLVSKAKRALSALPRNDGAGSLMALHSVADFIMARTH
ncbi:MAG: polyprenyl synthetase family protein [Euryarchaeota archaeon]|nr:polyprenyl synthetase family protein [Euryarchaeota archaeon]